MAGSGWQTSLCTSGTEDSGPGPSITVSEMQDTARRSNILARLEGAEQALAELRAKVHPSVRQRLRPAANAFANVRDVFLASNDDSDDSRDAVQEAWWLDRTEEVLDPGAT